MKKFLSCGILFSLIALCAPNAAAVSRAKQYLHPKVKSREYSIKSVLIVPPRVELMRLGIKGSEGMSKESDALAEMLLGMVVKQLEDRKVRILPNPFGQETLAKDEELAATLARVQGRYDSVATQLHKKPKDVQKARFSLGDEVANLGPARNADALVFLRGSGNVLTGGKKAFGWLVTGQTRNMLTFYVSFVDSKTGELLCIMTVFAMGDYAGKPDKTMGKTLTKSFSKLPLAGGT